MIKNQLINNCNVTIDDINCTELIDEPATTLLQGNMTRYQPKPDKIERIPLSLPIPEHHKYVQIYIDLFLVNGYLFLATKSERLDFVTAHQCKSIFSAQIKTVLDIVLDNMMKVDLM